MAESLRGTTAEHEVAEHEHREIARGVDRIHEVARFVGSVAAPDISIALLDVLDWIETILEPHASWEDAWLYPQIDERAGTPWATKLMTFEHHQIRALARHLEADRELLHREPSHDLEVELRGHLFAIEALPRAHIEREERFLIPLLEDESDPAVRVPVAIVE
jgi:hemerythrin-like domain-containing protein